MGLKTREQGAVSLVPLELCNAAMSEWPEKQEYKAKRNNSCSNKTCIEGEANSGLCSVT